jgi:hypothetical protein
MIKPVLDYNKPHPISQEEISIETKYLIIIYTRIFILLTIACAIVVGIMHVESAKFVTPLVLVFTLGSIGAYISTFKSLAKAPTEKLKILASSIVVLFVPALVGGMLALLSLLFFLSNILEAAVFPTFPTEEGRTGIELAGVIMTAPLAEFSKLLIFSFLAGFNQMFVTSFLDRLNDAVGNDTTEGNDEYYTKMAPRYKEGTYINSGYYTEEELASFFNTTNNTLDAEDFYSKDFSPRKEEDFE